MLHLAIRLPTQPSTFYGSPCQVLPLTPIYETVRQLLTHIAVAWITVMLTVIVFINVASNIVYLAAVTRDLFAFARDKVGRAEQLRCDQSADFA